MKNKKSEIISWEAYEFKAERKSSLWHIAYGIVSLALLTYAVIWASMMTVITFALLVIVSYFFAVKKPRKILHKITATGVSVGNVTYPYQNIKSFWVVYDPPHVKTLNFETTAYLNRYLKLELGDQEPVEVQEALSQYLPEDTERQEAITEKLLRKSKF